MTDSLTHRGPDGRGEYYRAMKGDSDTGVALGHRRLSIIDLAGGAQPMGNEDGSIQVLLNGEIYNYRSLRKDLIARGHQFQNDSDTEVISHLYEDHGTRCVDYLNGMFAIAVWDGRRKSLFLARDRMGQKPLFYMQQANRLLFGSELKSILAVPDVPRELDPLAVDQYLTLHYVAPPRSILRGISKLPPGHCLQVDRSGFKSWEYWSVPLPPRTHDPNATQAAIEQLPDLFTEAVGLRMQSDVPLGAFLSGGVDSSLIVALMQQQRSQPIRTFAVGFTEQGYDERSFARQVATHLGTEHREILVEADAAAILPQLAWHYDEPMSDSSAIPTWYISQATRKEVTVALTGDGGDELFGGYDRYRAARMAAWADRLPALVRKFFGSPIWQRIPHPDRQRSHLRRAKRMAEAIGLEPAERYLQLVADWRDDHRECLYAPAFAEQVAVAARVALSNGMAGSGGAVVTDAWRRSPTRDPVAAAGYADLCTYLPHDLMTKVDIASMAHSLECRQPFLDYRVVELASTLPTNLKSDARRGKLVLRQLFGSRLPETIWNRPKMGFGIPIHRWFRGPLAEVTQDLLLAPDARIRSLFNADSVHSWWEAHRSGQRDHGYHFWSLLMLESWMRQWLN